MILVSSISFIRRGLYFAQKIIFFLLFRWCQLTATPLASFKISFFSLLHPYSTLSLASFPFLCFLFGLFHPFTCRLLIFYPSSDSLWNQCLCEVEYFTLYTPLMICYKKRWIFHFRCTEIKRGAWLQRFNKTSTPNKDPKWSHYHSTKVCDNVHICDIRVFVFVGQSLKLLKLD
jgi:hypothetical protein